MSYASAVRGKDRSQQTASNSNSFELGQSEYSTKTSERKNWTATTWSTNNKDHHSQAQSQNTHLPSSRSHNQSELARQSPSSFQSGKWTPDQISPVPSNQRSLTGQSSGQSSSVPRWSALKPFDNSSNGTSRNCHKSDYSAAGSHDHDVGSRGKYYASSSVKEQSRSQPISDIRTGHTANPSRRQDEVPRAESSKKDVEDDRRKDIPEGKKTDSDTLKGKQLKRAPFCYKKSLPELRASGDHKVFFTIPPGGWKNELLLPYTGRDEVSWDSSSVRMPHSPQNIIYDGYGRGIPAWKAIWSALKQKINSSRQLEDAILSYNPDHLKSWTFEVLKFYFRNDERASETFFRETLPEMQKLALLLPTLFFKPIPILKKDMEMKLTLSQQQIASLLANAFFCTFPRRDSSFFASDPLPDINFNSLFSCQGKKAPTELSRKIEKIKCIINYFERVTKQMPTGTVTYARRCLKNRDKKDWEKLNIEFSELFVSAAGTIEDDGDGMLQVDFASKYIGGGVLNHGLVQEEIRFVICPEMILSRLFTEMLHDNEVFIMTGCERFSKYRGYSDGFKYDGDYVDTTGRDSWGRRYTEVVAMDALVIHKFKSQFDRPQVIRELNKAYCGFRGYEDLGDLPAVRTSGWGCGVYKGNKQLKALIQMMAASAAGRDICYLTFGDEWFCSELKRIHQILKRQQVKICDVFKLIKRYQEYLRVLKPGEEQQFTLFKFIAVSLGTLMTGPADDCDSYSEEDGAGASAGGRL